MNGEDVYYIETAKMDRDLLRKGRIESYRGGLIANRMSIALLRLLQKRAIAMM